jgi:hypothetical protein
MLRRCFFTGLFVAFTLALIAIPASTQDQATKTTYTYVSEWSVPRSMWPEMTKQETADRALLDKFIADGTITSYGEFMNLVHQEGQPTHGDWFQSSTQAGILRVLAALYAQAAVTSPVYANSKHWDYFLETDASESGGTSGTFTNAYLRVFAFQVKEGQEQNFDRLYKANILPVYQKLLSEGTLLYYGVDGQAVITSNPGDIESVVIAANADALDKTTAALQAAFANNPAAMQELQATATRESVRSFLSLVPYMKVK